MTVAREDREDLPDLSDLSDRIFYGCVRRGGCGELFAVASAFYELFLKYLDHLVEQVVSLVDEAN